VNAVLPLVLGALLILVLLPLPAPYRGWREGGFIRRGGTRRQ
jgi:hypothetical protein